MDLENRLRRLFDKIQITGYRLPELVIQVNGKQAGVYFLKDQLSILDQERRQTLIREIEGELQSKVEKENVTKLIQELEKEYYLTRMEGELQKDSQSSPVSVFYVWKGTWKDEAKHRLFLASRMWYQIGMKLDFINLDEGMNE
ncbi:MAG: hypothetical protein NTX88_05245 [Candidatus Atribacteria bacterium]|nr:hypothetical protein [Candidatus Atribacteria bacterium]